MDPADPHFRLIRLGSSRNIRESQVVTKVCEEQSCINQRMMVVVVCEFCHQKEVGPIVLTVRAEHAEIRLTPSERPDHSHQP